MRRRDLLKTGVLAGAAGLTSRLAGWLPGANGRPAQSHSNGRRGRGRARNVIFLAYDGTGYEDAAAAGYFSRRVLDRPLVFDRLLAQGLAGSMRTHSLTSIVTDSAAATTTWATGRKVVNPSLSTFPDGTALTTILELAKDRGMGTGLATTTRITHATPAGWAAKVLHRDMEDEIARQYLELEPDVLLGGGREPFERESRADGRDLFAEFRAKGYDVLHTTAALDRSNASRLLGVFTPGMQHLPYEVDRRFQGHEGPSLAEITRKALEVLAGSERGFVLQVEAGRIDHANHDNDPGAMIWDWVAAEEALGVLLDFVDRDRETLLIAAADHDTGAGAVYGFGPWYRRSTEAFETLGRCRASHEWLVEHALPPRPGPAEVREAVQRYLGIPLSKRKAESVAAVLGAERLTDELRRGHWNAHRSQPENTIAHLLSTSPDRQPDRPNIAFATGAHTAGVVPAVVYGAGVAAGNLGVIDNTELFGVMTDALGLDFENPVMTEEEALRLPPPSLQEVAR